MTKRIAVVGAGAKAAALVARAAILRELGVSGVPEIFVFESDHIAAAWTGRSHFTSGYLELCTPGEKDVGYPYADLHPARPGKAAVAPALAARFSWYSYLVRTGLLIDWVDRGRRFPSHSGWARYLTWVFEEAGANVVKGKVAKVRHSGRRWHLELEGGDDPSQAFDGVVLTGTGKARSVPMDESVPANVVLDAETFWGSRSQVASLAEGTIVVAGAGGAAGTILAWLAENMAEQQATIVSVSPMGTLFLRGDGRSERRWFSDPSDWRNLDLDDRRKLLERTEAGVLSLRIKQAIDQAANIDFAEGMVMEVRFVDNELEIRTRYKSDPPRLIKADYLVNAIGFDTWSLLDLVDHPRIATLRSDDRAGLRVQLEVEMLEDLSLPARSGLPPGLHVPGLASLAHGPGMGNLGCLGLVASSILDPYMKN